MWERSASSSVTGAENAGVPVSSGSEPFNTGPVERITERSMKFCNSPDVTRPGITLECRDKFL